MKLGTPKQPVVIDAGNIEEYLNALKDVVLTAGQSVKEKKK